MGPIKTESITLNKCNLSPNRLMIAIDSGCSLTKILFLNKKDHTQFLNKEENYITLEFSLFRNMDFEEALERIKVNACLMEDEDYKIHITGALAHSNMEKIKSVLNKDVIYIDEFMTVELGIKTVLEYIGVETMLMKDVELENCHIIEHYMFEKTFSRVQKTEDSFDNVLLYPCLVLDHGTLPLILYFDENKNSEFYGLLNEGVQMFLGLAKCILDTNDYDEIVELASRGDVKNVDLLIQEMIDSDKPLPGGSVHPDIPMFSFGKCIHWNKGKEEFSRDDLALSLVSMHMQQVALFLYSVCVIKNISKVYLTGNIFISQILRQELKKVETRFAMSTKFVILNCGFVGVLGAMFSD